MRQSSEHAALRRIAARAAVFTLALFAYAVSAQAQPKVMDKPIPSANYYNGVRFIESGDFSTAANFYRAELKKAIRFGAALWIDSICYYAMLGEACYQAGELNDALANYNNAMEIATAYPDWIGRVSYIGGVSTSPKTPAPWGASRRNVPLGVFPGRATITVGDKITDERVKKAAAGMTEQQAYPIDPIEIMRCIALSIRRRTEILGPLAPFDPMSQQILDAFQKRSVAPNHWSTAWLDVVWGLALRESDKTTSAGNTLANALLMAGSYDHTLTGQALFEMGNIFLQRDQVREAAECYYEASISAYHYGDNLLVEESIRNYSNAAKALGRGGDQVVKLAFEWAKTLKGAQTLTSSFGLELVEEFVYEGKTKFATSGLAAIDKTMRATAGRGLRTSRLADRWNYLNALLFYADGNIADGDEALAKVVEGCKLRSPWILQLIKLDNYVKGGLSSNGALTPRNAADLYEYLLREPTVVDWAVRPMESLSIQMVAPPDAYERWFCILMDRDLKEKAFEVAERVRRERFFRTQTYGGRLVSLRYILTSDDAIATPSIRNARQALLFEYPEFGDSMQTAKEIVAELNTVPTVPTDASIKTRQVSLFARLADLSARQEALMRFIAAGRERIPYVFPPVYSVADVQKRLPDDTAVLAFIDAEGETFGFMIGKENLDAWRVGSTQRLGAAVGKFLHTIGNTDGTRQVAAADLAEAHWKSQGAALREIVLGAQEVDADRFNIVFSKLVVVPDSVLWYLPFEALCLPKLASVEEETPEETEQPAEEDVKTGVLKASDAVNADGDGDRAAPGSRSRAQAEENAPDGRSTESEDEDDLDAAYTPTEDELPADDAAVEDDSESDEAVSDEAVSDAASNRTSKPSAVADGSESNGGSNADAGGDRAQSDESAPDGRSTESDATSDDGGDRAAPGSRSRAEAEESAPDGRSTESENASNADSGTTAADATSAPAKRKSKSAREKEALANYEEGLIPMIQASELTIRYSATVSLSLPNALGRNAFVETTVAAGATYPREPSERVEGAVDRFASSIAKTEAFRVGTLDVPGAIYAARLKRLVVFNEIVGNTWNWEPVIANKSRAGNTASDWIAAPWGAPRLFVAPALRTHAEDALKNGGDGSELFLPILAMQASGADAMLLSRWRTGGRSAYDAATDFVKNYESQPTADAWKHAALKLMSQDVVVDEEPRLRKLGRSESIPKYDSPFWWAGYMAIDSGEAVQAETLEQLDEDAVKKGEEENAILKDGNNGEGEGIPTETPTAPDGKAPGSRSGAQSDENAPDGDGSTESDAESGDSGDSAESGDDEEGVVTAKIVPGKSSQKKAADADKADAKSGKPTPATGNAAGKSEKSTGKSGALELGPKALTDDDLAAADDDGDDFFATDDEDDDQPTAADDDGAKSDDEPADDDDKSDDEENADDESADDEDEGLATDDDKPTAAADDSKNGDAPKSAPKEAPKEAPKADDKADDKPAPKEAPKADDKSAPKAAPKSTGRLKLGPKK